MSIQAANLYATVSVAGAANSVGQLRNVSNQVNATQSTLSKLSANAGQIGTGIGQVASGLVRVGEIAAVALGTAAAASAKVATGFQAQMELIHTQAGKSQQEVIDQSKAIQTIVHDVGTAPEELAKGLYHIESVGVTGAAALDILKASALGAKVGLADMETVSNALTAVWFSGIQGAKSMTDAMGILNSIIGVGNMRMQDLVGSFSTGVLGTAKTFGVSLQSLGAALAVLSDAGVPAEVASTRLQMSFTKMAAPIPAAVKILKTLGMTQFQMASDLRAPDGIFVALADLRTHLQKVGEMNAAGVLTPKGTADVAKIFGGSRFGASAMQLLGMLDRVQLKYDQINENQVSFSQSVSATLETAGFKWSQFTADIKESALAFGEGILPALARALGKIDTYLVGHLGDIRQLGVDVGAAIDRIDWTKVEAGVSSFVDLLKGAFSIIEKIPPEIDLMVVGFLGLNKLSGGLIGTGLGNIVGGLGKAAGNLIMAGFSKLPVVGSAVGAMTATRVYVVGGHLDGMGGGIPGVGGGLGGAIDAVAGGGIASILGAAIPAIIAGGGLALIMAAAGEWIIQNSPDPTNIGGRQATANARGIPGQVPTNPGPGRHDPMADWLAAGNRLGQPASGPSGGPLNLSALLNAIPGASALMGAIGTGIADRNAWVAAQTSHAGARSAFNVRTFRGSAAGSISEFPDLIRYLAGAQGAYGGTGSAGYLSTVAGAISTLERFQKTATPDQQDKIATEIRVLQGILRAKRFEPSPDLLNALKGDTSTHAGKAADDAVLALSAKVSTADDQRETNRLLGQALLQSPTVNVTVQPQPIKFVLNGRDIISGVILSNSFRRAATGSFGIG